MLWHGIFMTLGSFFSKIIFLVTECIPDPFSQQKKQSNSNKYRENEEDNTKKNTNKERDYHDLFNRFDLLITRNAQLISPV